MPQDKRKSRGSITVPDVTVYESSYTFDAGRCNQCRGGLKRGQKVVNAVDHQQDTSYIFCCLSEAKAALFVEIRR